MVNGEEQALARKTAESFSFPVPKKRMQGGSPWQGKGTINQPEALIGNSG
jgi:hypothetical protein